MLKKFLLIIFFLLVLVLSISICSYAENDEKAYFVRVPEATRVKEIKEYFEKEYDEDVIIYEQDNITKLTNNAIVKTGIIIDVSSIKQIVMLVVNGDINGDGRVSVTDLFILKRLIIEAIPSNSDYEVTADINFDGKITITDMAILKNLILRSLKTKADFDIINIKDNEVDEDNEEELDTTPPTAPTAMGIVLEDDKTVPKTFSITTNVGINSITASWSTTDETSGIKGYQYKIGNNAYSEITSATSHIFNGLVPSTTYTIYVKAIDNAGNTRAVSKKVSTQMLVDGNWDGEMNSPKLFSGMTPVYWDGATVKTATTKNQWYNYA